METQKNQRTQGCTSGRGGDVFKQRIDPELIPEGISASSQFLGETIVDVETDEETLITPAYHRTESHILRDKQEFPLYKYHQIPAFLQGNPYILSGYMALLPISKCYRR